MDGRSHKWVPNWLRGQTGYAKPISLLQQTWEIQPVIEVALQAQR